MEKNRVSGISFPLLLGLGVLGFFLYSLGKKAIALATLNFFPASVDDIYFDGATPVIRLSITAQNTSSQSLVLNSMAANLTAGGIVVGTVGAFSPVPIPGNSSANVEVAIRLSALGIVNDLIRAVQYGNFSESLKLDGYANVNDYQVPISMNFTAGLPA